jgi:hypothetical protein
MSDVVEDVVEAVERIPKADLNGTNKTQQWVILGVTAAVSAGAGATAAYFFLRYKIKAHYEELAKQEIDQSLAYMRHIRREKPEPGDILAQHEKEGAAAGDLAAKYEGIDPSEERVVEIFNPDGVTNVFDLDDESAQQMREKLNAFKEGDDPNSPKNGWDFETEKARRTANVPYVITEDEFFENASDKDQVSFTYFEGDGVLVDEQDKPVEDDSIVGSDNLTRFGQGTRDKNMVHVRNERLDLEFEIARSKGKYVVEVLGLGDDEDSLQHSGRRRPQRFRPDDD